MFQEPHRTLIVHKSLFCLAKLCGMRLSPAAHEPHRVFQMKHLVVQDVPHNIWGNSGVIELPVDDNLVERRIEAAEL